MQVIDLIKEFDKLQVKYGDKTLDAIYGAGEIDNPDICLVFMNPTGRNISSNKNWKGLKAPWIGTKNVWKMFFQLGLLDKEAFSEIQAKKSTDWNYIFSEKIYNKVKSNSLYITNLSKATQLDARHLKNEIFQKYLPLFYQEISQVNPKVIITFGNQVSSILLRKRIKVSEYRKKYELIDVNGKETRVFPVYYPVGQGMRNMKKAKEDIDFIIKTNIG